jgi:hypothetical protein
VVVCVERVCLCLVLKILVGAQRTFEQSIAWYEALKDRNEAMDEAYVKILRASGDFKLKHKKYVQNILPSCCLSLLLTQFTGMNKLSRCMRNSLKRIEMTCYHCQHLLSQLLILTPHWQSNIRYLLLSPLPRARSCTPYPLILYLFKYMTLNTYEARIPTVGDNVNVDVDALENLPAPRFAGKESTGITDDKGKKKDVKGGEKDKDKKKKRKKKTKLPKNYNPSVKPDPERWLPKWQRSYFNRKQRKGVVGKGSQGLSLPQASSMLGAGSANPTPAPASAKPAAPTVTQAQVKQAARNAKKKGRR